MRFGTVVSRGFAVCLLLFLPDCGCIVYDLYISWVVVLLFSVLFCVVLTVFDAQYYVDVYFGCGACVCVCVILTCFARFAPLNPCRFWRMNSVGL